MKKSSIDKIESDIKEKTVLPKNIKETIKKEVFINIVIAITLMVYFAFIVLGSIGAIKNVRSIDLNIFSLLFLGISIFIFEVAYKKDSGSLAIYGIESLIVAIFTLFLPFIIFELDETYKKMYLYANIYISIYYVIKSIFISIKTKSKYMNSISDVKEIVKNDKNKRRQEKEESEIKNIEPIVVEKNENKKDNDNKKVSKKRGRPKKDVIKVDKKEQTSKRRGRPRKVEIKK